MQKALIILGLIIVVIGLAWPLLGSLPFGRLPGDIVIEKDNMRVYIPITTMIILSVVISLIIWFTRS